LGSHPRREAPPTTAAELAGSAAYDKLHMWDAIKGA
jgi:hypothetical protein